jgi:hypothetical protein
MNYLVYLNRSCYNLTFISLLDSDLDLENYQNLVNLVSLGLLDDLNREVKRVSLLKDYDEKAVKCLLFDDRIHNNPCQSKHVWLCLSDLEDLDLSNLYYSADTKKYLKSFLNMNLEDKMNKFLESL